MIKYAYLVIGLFFGAYFATVAVYHQIDVKKEASVAWLVKEGSCIDISSRLRDDAKPYVSDFYVCQDGKTVLAVPKF